MKSKSRGPKRGSGANPTAQGATKKQKSSARARHPKAEAIGLRSPARVALDEDVVLLPVTPKNCNEPRKLSKAIVWKGDTEKLLKSLPNKKTYDLVVTSPPYNIGKPYESKSDLDDYLEWQERIISEIVPRVKEKGSICWQVGNYVDNGKIVPLDIELAPIFHRHKLQLRNRIIWHFGHGLHNRRRFSGRYEVILWYTKTDDYYFNVDTVRVPSKYPAKKYFKGPKKGQYSGNPLGKNPEDVWTNIPNVKSNHIEKTEHPCQFPVGLIERLVLSMTKPGGTVFDPFCGSGSAGVASLIHGRKFVGCEINQGYAKIAFRRVQEAAIGKAKYRAHDVPIYDASKSNLSVMPFSEK